MVPLANLGCYRVADGEPDVRGWHVVTRDGTRAGEVYELVVDVQGMTVSYLDVELDADALRLRGPRHVLVPPRVVWLNEDEEIARLNVTTTQLIAAPPYDPGSFSDADDRRLRRRYSRYRPASEAELEIPLRRRMALDVGVCAARSAP